MLLLMMMMEEEPSGDWKLEPDWWRSGYGGLWLHLLAARCARRFKASVMRRVAAGGGAGIKHTPGGRHQRGEEERVIVGQNQDRPTRFGSHCKEWWLP